MTNPAFRLAGVLTYLVLSGLLLTATAGARAQEQAEGPASMTREEAAAAKLKQIAEELSRHGDGDVPPADSDVDPAKEAPQPSDPPRGVVFDEETEAAYRKAWQAYYKYRVQGYEDRLQVFAWQSISTKVIFGVVVALVLAGVYFAAVQFHVGMRAGREAGEAGEVEMSFKGVKVRSPVLGVIVLTISLGFFYLYLVYVYPIENVF